MRSISPATMSDLRCRNEMRVMELVCREGPIPRTDIAERTGLTRTTISSVVSSLIARDWVVEASRGKASANGGRRSILLVPKTGNLLALGIDLRLNYLSIVVVNAHGEILGSVKRDVDLNATIPSLEGQITQEVLSFAAPWMPSLVGVGITSFGPIDYDTGSASLPGTDKKRLALRRLIEGGLNMPAVMDTGSNMAACGEFVLRNEPQDINMLYITLGAYVGSGIVLQGKATHGGGPFYGLGHISVDPYGPPCYCGSRGCLEQHVSIVTIYNKLQGNTTQNDHPSVVSGSQAESYSRYLYNRFAKGDPEIKRAIGQASDYLVAGTVSLLNLIGPMRVVIGSTEPFVTEMFLPGLAKAVDKLRTARGWPPEIKVQRSSVQDNTLAYGAARAAFNEFLNNPAWFAEALKKTSGR